MRPPGGILAPGESIIATGNIIVPFFFFNKKNIVYISLSHVLFLILNVIVSVQVCGAT